VKNILLILSILCSFSLSARNRIATDSDKQIYGDYINCGDLIIDTPTKVSAQGIELIYYFMAKQWPMLRNGSTIWLDGQKLGRLAVVKFTNTASALTPWHIESATFRNIPNTQVVANMFFCQGLKHFELNGESSTYPGLSQWPESRKFLTGAFGFHVISKMFQGHGFNISVLDGGTIKMKGFEVQHGFSALRINGGDYDITVEELDITNFYIHDTGDGEGMYLGATHAPPFAKLKNLKIYQGIITRTAAEALQLQHLAGGADVHNITIRSTNVRWMNEFMKGQDTGIQWNIERGENQIHHIIVDGFASVGLVPFGNEGNVSGTYSQVSDILFNDGIDTGIYLHKSGSKGVNWNFENIYYRSFNSGSYYKNTGRPERKFIISEKVGTDLYAFKNIIHDGSKHSVFQDTIKSKLKVKHVNHRQLPAPEYKNSGFYESAGKIRQWFQYYAKYFPASKGGTVMIPTDWQNGDIAIETEGEYSFYKCIRSHTSSEQRPSQSSNFVKLTWDENGIRSDQPSWNRYAIQSYFPPDDLRLKDDNYWRELNFGYYEASALGRK
jgi:hypothetical protein